MKTNFVYNSYLKAISNYKLDDLINIANECNICLTNQSGKKKPKKDSLIGRKDTVDGRSTRFCQSQRQPSS